MIRFTSPDYLDLMLDVEAAVGIEQLKKYDHIIEHRKLMARRYNHELACKVGWLPPIINGTTYSHYVVSCLTGHPLSKSMKS